MKAKLVPFGWFIAGVVIALVGMSLSGAFGVPVVSERKLAWADNSLANAREITCTFRQTVRAEYMDGNITHSLPAPETNPLIFTFTGLESQTPELKSLDATQTISETPLLKIFENDERIVLLEGTGDAYITTLYIFKKTGVAIYTKAVDILGIPIGSVAMGTCIGI